MRPAFLGTSEFAAQVLEDLAGSRHPPSIVITPPDRPRGRGRKLASPPAAERARELGLELLQTGSASAEDQSRRLVELGEPCAVVCAFGQIIREPLLSSLPMLNVHPSLLPRWRGAAPIERAIMAGDERTGVSIIRITEGLDSGPMLAARELGLDPDASYGELAPRLAAIGSELLLEALDRAERGDLEGAEQDDAAATYAEKIGPDDRRLDPRAEDAAALRRRVLALTPHIGAHLELSDGERLGVTGARALDDGPGPGQVDAGEGALVVGCLSGALELTRVKPAGRREMAVADYLRGGPDVRLAGT